MMLWEAVRELQAGNKVMAMNWGKSYIQFEKGLLHSKGANYCCGLDTLLRAHPDGWSKVEDDGLVPFSEVPVGERCEYSDKSGYLSGYLIKMRPVGLNNAVGVDEAGLYFCNILDSYMVRYPITTLSK